MALARRWGYKRGDGGRGSAARGNGQVRGGETVFTRCWLCASLLSYLARPYTPYACHPLIHTHQQVTGERVTVTDLLRAGKGVRGRVQHGSPAGGN